MTTSLGGKLTMTRQINATPDEVFAAWTVPAEYRKWGAPGPATVAECEMDPRVGGAYRIVMDTPDGKHEVAGTYKEVVPGKRLVFTWSWTSNDNPASLVTIDLAPKDGGTEMVVTHTGMVDDEDVRNHAMGWEGCLAKLEELH